MRFRRFAVPVTLLVSSVAGCGGSGGVTSGSQPSVSAQPPSGPNARTVSYSCADNTTGTIAIDVPSSDQLADVVNAVNVCEFNGGLVDISVKLPCQQGDRMISVAAEGNKLSNQAVTDACALGS